MILLQPMLLFLVSACVVFFLRVVLFKTGLIFIVKKWWRRIEDFFQVSQSFKVPEFNENTQENLLYNKISVYLNSLASIEDSDFTNLFTGKKSSDIVLRLDPNQVVEDVFLGARVVWINQQNNDGLRNFVLKFRKADKRRILRPYLQHIHSVSDELEQRKREIRLYMNVGTGDCGQDRRMKRSGRWSSVPFTHPSSFDTLSLEADLKNKVKSDLESFIKAKQYYHRLGRAWKRSYLLYGPTGTGKSSFVAAMANFLCYDVYDIDLSKVTDDSDLKMLLLQTTSKSVIVIEDLDRFLLEKPTSVTLSGVLNFMDGIASSCVADERLMVFTMNGKDQIDPAVLRPGRIDVHIQFSLCDFASFKTLANSYLGVKDHKLFPQVEEIFQNGASLSPAEIGELMIANRNSPSRALKTVICALQTEGDGRGSGIGRQLSYSASRKQGEELGEASFGFGAGGGTPAMKELRKLYGLLKIRSCRKSESFDFSQELREV